MLLFLLVFSLPMRNWNNIVSVNPIHFCSVFSLPMRNWNRKYGRASSAPSKFSAYLWGIETETEARYCRSQKPFSAYLWGIETGDQFLWQIVLPVGFQPTYEELKLLSSACSSSGRTRFQPTYEELKRKCTTDILRGWNSFQPTYEELKLKPMLQREPKITVFSLPMRNWNVIYPARMEVVNQVFSLPMRNWNYQTVPSVFPAPLQFSAYLWGIETDIRIMQ